MALKGEAKKEYQKNLMRKRRSNKEGSNSVGLTEEMVPASFVNGVNRKYQSLPERPRYLSLSDGQVLDRSYQATGVAPMIPFINTSILMSNDACYGFTTLKSKLIDRR